MIAYNFVVYPTDLQEEVIVVGVRVFLSHGHVVDIVAVLSLHPSPLTPPTPHSRVLVIVRGRIPPHTNNIPQHFDAGTKGLRLVLLEVQGPVLVVLKVLIVWIAEAAIIHGWTSIRELVIAVDVDNRISAKKKEFIERINTNEYL